MGEDLLDFEVFWGELVRWDSIWELSLVHMHSNGLVSGCVSRFKRLELSFYEENVSIRIDNLHPYLLV